MSLLDLKHDLYQNSDCLISQEALHKKFTKQSVEFLKKLLSELIHAQVQSSSVFAGKQAFQFTGIHIKDSSKISLPSEYAGSFPGYGGYCNRNTSLLNIQYEYDLLSGNWRDLTITSALRNDQQDSKETADDILEGSLNLRDLGYITSTYLKAVEKQKAYYLNRLPKIGVHIQHGDTTKKLNWVEIDKQMKLNQFNNKEFEVCLGENKDIKCRMIISSVPDKVKKGRIGKATRGGQRKKGYNISEEHKLRAGYNIFITNIPSEILSSEQVVQTYRLRWQIELLFKAWKSILKLDKIKPVKVERMLCQLYAKFIWVLLNNQLLNIANQTLKRKYPDKACSPLKFFKAAIKLSPELRLNITNSTNIFYWIENMIIGIIPIILIEKRMKQPSHNQLVYQIFLRLS